MCTDERAGPGASELASVKPGPAGGPGRDPAERRLFSWFLAHNSDRHHVVTDYAGVMAKKQKRGSSSSGRAAAAAADLPWYHDWPVPESTAPVASRIPADRAQLAGRAAAARVEHRHRGELARSAGRSALADLRVLAIEMADLDQRRAAVAARQADLVVEAVGSGESWGAIGEALGIARQNAFRRFSGLVNGG